MALYLKSFQRSRALGYLSKKGKEELRYDLIYYFVSFTGMRFGLMEGKLCLVHLLRKYTIEVVSKTQIPLQLKKSSFSKTGENGIWVGLKPRDNL